MNIKYLLTFVLISQLSFAQSFTKKYNSYQNHYEYFDTTGLLIGYEKYNTYSKQWEYYKLTSQQTQISQYKDPAKVDLSSTINAASTKQQRYNNGVQRVQNTINTINAQVETLKVSDYEKVQILGAFSDIVTKVLNTTSYDYSSLSKTNEIINWLYSSISRIVNNVQSKEVDTSKTTEINASTSRISDIKNGSLIYRRMQKYEPPLPEARNDLAKYIDLYNNYSSYHWDFNQKAGILHNIIKNSLRLEQIDVAHLYNEKMLSEFPHTKYFYYLNKAQIAINREQYSEVLKITDNISSDNEKDFSKDKQNTLYDLAIIDNFANFYSFRGLAKIKTGKKTDGCIDIQKAIAGGGHNGLYFNNQYCKKK